MQMNPFQVISALSPLLTLTPLAPLAPVLGSVSSVIGNLQGRERSGVPMSSSYALGGKLKRITDGSLEVDSDEGMLDDVRTSMGNFDDKEVIWENFVFSNRIINPYSGNSFSADAKRILDKLRTVSKSKGYRDVKTLSLTRQLLENLAKAQENIKMMISGPSPVGSYFNGGPLNNPRLGPVLLRPIEASISNDYVTDPTQLIATPVITGRSVEYGIIPPKPLMTYDPSFYIPPPVEEEVPPRPPRERKFSVGDKLQIAALISQGIPLLFRPREEPYERLNYHIPYLHHDITPYIEEGRKGLISALRTTTNYASPSLRALMAAGALASQGALLDKLMETSYRSNQGSLEAYMRALAARDTANAELFARNQAINQANRAKYLDHLNTFATSVANFGAALNERQAAKDYLELLKEVYKIK